MKIEWLTVAQTDLEEAFDYLLERNPQAAVRLYQIIKERVELLANHPHLGRPGRVTDTRELVISGTAYIVAYTVDIPAGRVVILRVLHGRRVWPEELE